MDWVKSFFNQDKVHGITILDHGEKPLNHNEKDLGKQYSRDSSSPGIQPQLSVHKSQEFDPITSNMIDQIIEDDYAAPIVEDDSPYPEVRAAVPSTDDPNIPQNTIRMWFIGLAMTTLGCGMNLLFSMHSPSFAITTFVTSIIAWPIGLAWARWIPNVNIFGAPLNPGPFTLKEHTLITIMANVRYVL